MKDPLPRLYHQWADLWPTLSPPEDYLPIAQKVLNLIDQYILTPGRPRVLELGAGAGHTLVHLAPTCDVTAVDLSSAMLTHCEALVPEAACITGDMRTLRLDDHFDIVLLHDAIDHMTTDDDAQAAIRTAAHHLRPGGLAVIAPTYTRETFSDREAAFDQPAPNPASSKNDVLAYLSVVHDADTSDALFDLVVVVVARNASGHVQVLEDRQTCGLFSDSQWHAWIEQADLHQVSEPADANEPTESSWMVCLKG